MEQKRSSVSGFSAIQISAALSVILLIASAAYQIDAALRSKSVTTSFVDAGANPLGDSNDTDAFPSGAGDSASSIASAVVEEIALAYLDMRESGTYSEEEARKVGADLAERMLVDVQYEAYAAADIKTDTDTSPERVLVYRSDLQKSLAPLLDNVMLEYEIFARYVETGDAAYLDLLRKTAANYRSAAAASALAVVPADALQNHLEILNAMQHMATTLDTLAAYADDPFASTALLRSYNEAESHMLTSFDGLLAYQKLKQS